MEEQFRKVGAPLGIMSDNAKAELHGKAKELLNMYNVDDRQSEPYYQHQNPAERAMQDVKRRLDGTMDRMNVPSEAWLITIKFILMLMLVLPNSNGLIPGTVVTGQTMDISKFMHFHFWQEVFVATDDKNAKEELARWCYPADNCGDELTYMVLLDKTKQLVPRSNVQPAKDPLYPNLCLRPQTDNLRSKPYRTTVETVHEDDDDDVSDDYADESPSVTATSGEPETAKKKKKSPVYTLQDSFDVPVNIPRFSPEELIGLTFLHDTGDQRLRAKIVKKVRDRDAENHERIKMLISYGDDEVEELMSYNELCDIVSEQIDQELKGEKEIFTFREILDHEGPLLPGDKRYRGSKYNTKMLWEDYSETWEPLDVVGKCDPITCAAYAKEHGLLNKPGWKRFKKVARRAKVLKRMVNASKRNQRYNAVIYKFGV